MKYPPEKYMQTVCRKHSISIITYVMQNIWQRHTTRTIKLTSNTISDVLHLKLWCKALLAINYEMLHSRDEQIIHIQYENECILTSYNIVEVRICLTLLKPHLKQLSIYPRIPSSWSLLQTIKCLSQKTHMGLSPQHLKPLWLFYVHLLLYKSIQKRSLYIHLMYPPTHLCCNVNNALDISVSRNWGERLIIVGSLYLRESSHHRSGLVFLYVSICSILGLIQPPGSHNWLPLRPRHHLSHIIAHDGVLLLLHGLSPNMLVKCLCKCRGICICDVCHHSQVRSKFLWHSTLYHQPLGLSYILIGFL